jgi:uncharacterized glyoxalase superfamily protein PhnB
MAKSETKRLTPIINVDSVDQFRSFYCDELGFTHRMGVIGKDGQLDFCSVHKGGVDVMFTRAQNGSAAAGHGRQPVEIYLEVDDLQAYHDSLKKRKAVQIVEGLTMQWWGDRTFKVEDPGGYVIWFYEHVGEPKPPQGAKLV